MADEEFPRLIRELDASKAAHRVALAAVDYAIKLGAKLGANHPEVQQALKKANKDETTARLRYRAAVDRVNGRLKHDS